MGNSLEVHQQGLKKGEFITSTPYLHVVVFFARNLKALSKSFISSFLQFFNSSFLHFFILYFILHYFSFHSIRINQINWKSTSTITMTRRSFPKRSTNHRNQNDRSRRSQQSTSSHINDPRMESFMRHTAELMAILPSSISSLGELIVPFLVFILFSNRIC